MGGNNIYGPVPSSIGELRGLELLNLTYCSTSGEILAEIGLLRELRVLALADNTFSGKLPNSVGNLNLLTKIDLSKNELVGAIPSTFGNLQSIISVDLSGNKLNGSVPDEILDLPRLSVFLNLSQNRLTSSWRVKIRRLENVATINISNNLSGNIPRSIGNCRNLEQLSFAGNMLSGPIPDSIESVKGFEILDLSSYQLIGPIPSNLQNLQSLHLLNLSNNDLEGEVPTGGSFAYPSKFHQENNSGLSNSRGRKWTMVSTIISVIVALSLCYDFG